MAGYHNHFIRLKFNPKGFIQFCFHILDKSNRNVKNKAYTYESTYTSGVLFFVITTQSVILMLVSNY